MNKATFRDRITTFIKAGIPITVVKTREPAEAIEAISEAVDVQNQRIKQYNTTVDIQSVQGYLAFGVWDLYGWTIKDSKYFSSKLAGDDGVEEPEPDTTTTNFVAAFETILAKNAEDGIYVMDWPHFGFSDPLMKTYLKHTAILFNGSVRRRLVLVIPESAEIPPELHDFVSFITYEVPSQEERVEMIRKFYDEDYKRLNIAYTEDDLARIANSGGGLTGFELINSTSRALQYLESKGLPINVDTVSELLLKQKTEMVHRTGVLEVMPTGKMEDVGGLEAYKEWISKRKNCFSQSAKERGIDIPRGIALAGSPGTGKSLVAKATAHTLGFDLIKFNVPSVFGSLVGSSEAKLKQTLEIIKALSPAVVLVDEIDKVFNTNSGNGDSGVGNRVLGQILTFMQENEGTFWVITFNKHEGLPPELLRKGRLDEIFSVDLPSAADREAILRIHLKKRKQDSTISLVSSVKFSDGYNGAELEAAVKEALIESYSNNVELSDELISQQIRNMRPLSLAFPEQIASMRAWANNNARPASKPQETMQTCAKIPTTKTKTNKVIEV